MTTDDKTRPLEREVGPGKTSGGRAAILNAALELAANGWAVFPCIPYCKDAKASYILYGFHDATTDADKIKRGGSNGRVH